MPDLVLPCRQDGALAITSVKAKVGVWDLAYSQTNSECLLHKAWNHLPDMEICF